MPPKQSRNAKTNKTVIRSQKAGGSGSNAGGDNVPTRPSFRAMLRTLFFALVVGRIAMFVPWLIKSLPLGSSMPDLWVRPMNATPGNFAEAGLQPRCGMVEADAPGFRFCEDLEHIPGTSSVLVTCDAERHLWNTVMGPLSDPEPRGTLWTYDYELDTTGHVGARKKAVPIELVGFPASSDLHPLGTGLLHVPSNGLRAERWRLAMVNHRRRSSSIEIFDLSRSASGGKFIANHVRTVTHPLATHTPNSIHMLSENEMLVSQDHMFARRPASHAHMQRVWEWILSDFSWLPSSVPTGYVASALAHITSFGPVAAVMAEVETVLGLPLSWVSYLAFQDKTLGGAEGEVEVSGVNAHVVASGIPFPNGVLVSPDEKTLVIASTMMPGVYVYGIDAGSGAQPLSSRLKPENIHMKSRFHLPFMSDNLAFSHSDDGEDGAAAGRAGDVFGGLALLASGHPSPLETIGMAKSPFTKTAPSWTVAITASDGSADAKVVDPAPLPVHKRTLSSNPAFQITTLLQTKGKTLESSDAPAYILPGDHVEMPTSTSTFAVTGGRNKGTLLVSGLYAGVLDCRNVGIAV
ncbi:hypothetical protein BCV70DRAFT_98661 [Testicularia cyperi]|uniref:Calcium-dependent phosphotriesterase n=1 Tax=Testicularia cyperi TaxID=1882483 RepID=A0A317XRX7_9BASI|nr:hypothetical protein BCV70DRAFT_98661 [Testicularia cyperi]